MESKAEIITKKELERWQNVENIEEIPLETLRAMYLDLKENSVSKEEVLDAIHSILLKKYEEIETLTEVHERLKNGEETEADLLKYYPNFLITFKFEGAEGKEVETRVIEVKYYKKLIDIVKQKEKIIDEMAKQLSGLAIFDVDIEDAMVLENAEEVKKYFERKIENNE